MVFFRARMPSAMKKSKVPVSSTTEAGKKKNKVGKCCTQKNMSFLAQGPFKGPKNDKPMKAKEVDKNVRFLVKCKFSSGEAKEEGFKGGRQGSQDGNWQWRSCKGNWLYAYYAGLKKTYI